MGATITANASAVDPGIAGKGYVHPEVLVSTDWLAEHLDDPTIRIIESDEDVLLYDTGHIPGAQKVDWHQDLNDPVLRDYVSSDQFEKLLREKGIDENTTVVFYGDKNNWWAAYAFWVFQLFGFTNAKLLDGGRIKWEQEHRPFNTDAPRYKSTNYKAPPRADEKIRAFFQQVREHSAIGRPLIDVRSPEEYTGQRTHMPDYPQEAATSRERAAFHGRARRIPMEVSKMQPRCEPSTSRRRVSRKATTSLPTAASARDLLTPGSCLPTSSATIA